MKYTQPKVNELSGLYSYMCVCKTIVIKTMPSIWGMNRDYRRGWARGIKDREEESGVIRKDNNQAED